jgi:hypothetical protein
VVTSTDGAGSIHGLDALEDAGEPIFGPGRTRADAAAANNAANAKPCDHVEGHADAKTDLTENPWSRF